MRIFINIMIPIINIAGIILSGMTDEPNTYFMIVILLMQVLIVQILTEILQEIKEGKND